MMHIVVFFFAFCAGLRSDLKPCIPPCAYPSIFSFWMSAINLFVFFIFSFFLAFLCVLAFVSCSYGKFIHLLIDLKLHACIFIFSTVTGLIHFYLHDLRSWLVLIVNIVLCIHVCWHVVLLLFSYFLKWC